MTSSNSFVMTNCNTEATERVSTDYQSTQSTIETKWTSQLNPDAGVFTPIKYSTQKQCSVSSDYTLSPIEEKQCDDDTTPTTYPALNVHSSRWQLPNNHMKKHSVQDYAMLSPIQEEQRGEREDDVKSFTFPDINMYMYGAEWQPQSLPSSNEILQCKDVIFIPKEITQCWVNNSLFAEYFEKDSDLFYYLRYQTRMQVIDALYKVFRCAENVKEIVIFNAELRDKNTKSQLFIIGHQNDGKHWVKWKMVTFMTALQILEAFNINTSDLPFGSRWSLYQKIESQTLRFKRDIQCTFCLNINKMNKLMDIAQIKPERKTYTRPLVLTRDQLFECIKASIYHNTLIPTIWFNKNKRNPMYRIQMLLPVEIENEWFGISFDYDNKHQLIPVKICIDDVDIRRKLCLFKPSVHPDQYRWFSNEITEIKIVTQHIYNYLSAQHQQVNYEKKRALDLWERLQQNYGNINRLKN